MCLDHPWAGKVSAPLSVLETYLICLPVVKMVGWGAKLSYSEHGSSKLAISHVVPIQFVPFPPAAKARFLGRSQRMYAAAQVLREGGPAATMGAYARRPLRPTAEETQQIHQDWRDLLLAIGVAED